MAGVFFAALGSGCGAATGAIAQALSLPLAFGAFVVALAAAGLGTALFGPAEQDASFSRKE